MIPTAYIDSDHPAVGSAVFKAIGDAVDDVQRAVRIHDFVRDKVKFGWASAFYDQPASRVLKSGVGFCNTKSTLFVAMLRAADIPARQHFVNINTEIIAEFFTPAGDYVDHSYSEVFLDNRWISVDSYIVDLPLFDAARERLKDENKQLGYGIHRNGTPHWDGRSNAFAQFVDDGSFSGLTTRDHGSYADVGEFYAYGERDDELGIAARLSFLFAKRQANDRINRLRLSALS